MTGERWRKHVESKGWTQENTIVIPEGKELTIHFEDGWEIKVNKYCTVTYDDELINAVSGGSALASGLLATDVAALWDNVSKVKLGMHVDLSTFFAENKKE